MPLEVLVALPLSVLLLLLELLPIHEPGGKDDEEVASPCGRLVGSVDDKEVEAVARLGFCFGFRFRV